MSIIIIVVPSIIWFARIHTADFMQIFVQIGAEKRITIIVQPSDTISHIKAKIKEKEGFPPDEQLILLLDGKLLENGCTVSSYNMHNGSTLFGASGIIIL